MILIKDSVLAEVQEYCYKMKPEEACGVLFGYREKCALQIVSCRAIRNVSTEPEHQFVMDPQEWIKVWYASIEQEFPVVGIFHSHPRTPAIPSKKDNTSLWHTLPSYWIISLMNEKPAVKAYKYEQGSWNERTFAVV